MRVVMWSTRVTTSPSALARVRLVLRSSDTRANQKTKPRGLYYYGARYDDPSIGRFITEDPASPILTDPQSLNRYAYARNNPLKYTDPDGRFIFAPILAVALIGMVISLGFYAAESIISSKKSWYKGALRSLPVALLQVDCEVYSELPVAGKSKSN